MSERQCPICKSDMYLNPDILIYISPCFHKMCESCMYRIFNKGQAPCPECGTMLRKINYITPTFEDIQVERECKIRRALLRVFRREEGEFSGDEVRYNDYLEEFEDLVFELLELKSESLVREKIKKIQDMGSSSVLNPNTRNAVGDSKDSLHAKKKIASESLDEAQKTLKVGLFNDYFNPEDLSRIVISPKHKILLPDGLFTVSKPGGLTKEMIISMAISSLDNGAI